ncbi:MAG: nucleotidyltransferase domain-containing protein [Armatimonadetes bacterium]|nr:nucleotidyltransferase domain-containing protein [Armatimonadota bacterium]
MRLEREVLDTLVARIVEAIHPDRIVLFGSAARGEMRPDSDVDVLVVVSEGTHRRHAAQAVYRHLIGFEHPVDVVVATESDLRELGDNFSLVYYPALREGREIYAIERSNSRVA